MEGAGHIRIILIGAGNEFREAADMAREIGAKVALVPTGEEAVARLLTVGADLVIADVACGVPSLMTSLKAQRIMVPVLACGIRPSAEQAVAAIRAGAQDFLTLPPQHDLIAAAILSVGRRATEIVGTDPVLSRVLDLAQTFAHSLLPILIIGQPGTGKETLARKIHNASGRDGPFLSVECAGVAPEVVESELFGHRRDAFPGAAADRAGRLLEASDGTVFIRNVDLLPPSLQARLAAVLQEATLEAADGVNRGPLTARVLASSAEDLAQAVSDGRFRADLQSRLALVQAHIPPLTHRAGDIAALAQHFVTQMAVQNGLLVKQFTSEALLLLRSYVWPGNVRELQDVVHRAVAIATDDKIGVHDLLLSDGALLESVVSPRSEDQPLVKTLVGHTVADVERELILRTLERCGGNRTSASVILGISVRTMRNKLRSFMDAGIPVAPAL